MYCFNGIREDLICLLGSTTDIESRSIQVVLYLGYYSSQNSTNRVTFDISNSCSISLHKNTRIAQINRSYVNLYVVYLFSLYQNIIFYYIRVP